MKILTERPTHPLANVFEIGAVDGAEVDVAQVDGRPPQLRQKSATRRTPLQIQATLQQQLRLRKACVWRPLP